jgi:hypothetical protein
MTNNLVEEIAIMIAEGNNGGAWATHYTEEQKEVWRNRARKILVKVAYAMMDMVKDHGTDDALLALAELNADERA